MERDISQIDDDQIRTLPTSTLDSNIFATFFEMLSQCALHEREDAPTNHSSSSEDEALDSEAEGKQELPSRSAL